jgi:hypothetical protein
MALNGIPPGQAFDLLPNVQTSADKVKALLIKWAKIVQRKAVLAPLPGSERGTTATRRTREKPHDKL